MQLLLVLFFGGHTATVERICSQVSSMSWINGTNRVLGIEDLLCELWNCQCTVLLGSTRGQWCVTSRVEMKAWEWDSIHSILAEISFGCPGKRRQDVTTLMLARTKYLESL
jgi:hypothetical protein